MKNTCKNCGHLFIGNFCNHCGQEANTTRLNSRFLWNDVQQGLLNFDRGLFFTLKQLSLRPGASIREFVEGKRVNFSSPIAFVLVLATIYAALFHFFHVDMFQNINHTPNSYDDTYYKLTESIVNHYALYSLGMIPFSAIVSYVIFRKQGYNYIEHLVLNIYLTGQRIYCHILLFPLLIIFNEHTTMRFISWLTQGIDILLLLWCYSQFFNKLKRWKTWLLSLLSYTMLFILLMFIMVGVVLTITYLSKQ